jgi:flavin-dependent dehydrogenase
VAHGPGAKTVEHCVDALLAQLIDEGEFNRAQLVIITTGGNRSLSRALRLARPRQLLLALQTELTLPPNGHGIATRVHVGQDVAPGAFAWGYPAG